MKLQHLALFPLPSHILPGGKLPLRLFEPRHLQMLKESFIDDRGFGIVMEESTSTGTCGRILPVGGVDEVQGKPPCDQFDLSARAVCHEAY